MSFAGGMTQGLDIMQRIRAMQAMNDQAKAQAAVGRSYGGLPGQAPMPGTYPQPPMPGQSSVPAGNGMGPSPDMAMSAPPPMTLPQDNSAPPPPMPMAPPGMGPSPDMQPAAPAGPATGAGGDPLTGAASPGLDPVQDAQSTVQSIAKQIKANNPNIDPGQLFAATQVAIDQMKGVRNEVKDYMWSMAETAKVQAREKASQDRLQGVQITADSRVESSTIRGDAQRDVADTAAGARRYSADRGYDRGVDTARITGENRVTAAQIAADTNRYVQDKKYQGLVYDKTLGAYVKMDNARVGAQGRVDAATAGAGTDPATRGTRFQTGNGGAPKSRYKSAADVKKAYDAGRLTRDQAASELINGGWASR